MRLINFGPGEIADRLTILALKMAYGTAAGKPIEHFERERNALLPLFTNTTHKRWLEHYTELGAVNALIWAHTEEVRNLRDVHPTIGKIVEVQRLAWLAIQLQNGNDHRAELITIINGNSGNTEEGAEKL